MFNVGFSELLILGVIALIFIGPQQLPEVARTVGRLLNEWKRATTDLQSSLTSSFSDDLHERRKEIHQDELSAAPTDQDIAVRVEQETPATAKLPEGAAPVAGHHEDES